MKKSFTAENLRVGYCLGILLLAVCSAIYFFERPSAAQRDDVEKTKITEEAEGLADFREATGSRVKPVIVELREDPGAVIQFQKGLANPDAFEAISAYALRLVNNQDAFRRSLPERGVQNLLRATKVRQIDGSVRLIEYRFTYLLNGFVAYIPVEQIEQLKAQPEVKNVYEIEESRFMLDNSIDYSLGTQFNPFDRRLAT